MKKLSIAVLVAATVVLGSPSVAPAGLGPDPGDTSISRGDAGWIAYDALKDEFGQLYVGAPEERISCGTRISDLTRRCRVLFVTSNRRGLDLYVGHLTVGLEEPVAEDGSYTYFWGGKLRQYDGRCIIRTGGPAGCKERTHHL